MPRIRHLAIVSPNRERLVNFYTTAFDLRVVYGRPTSTHLSDGDFNLAIVDQKPDLKPGLYVLGFDVDDLQDLEGSLKKAGASSELTPMPSLEFLIQMGTTLISRYMGGALFRTYTRILHSSSGQTCLCVWAIHSIHH